MKKSILAVLFLLHGATAHAAPMQKESPYSFDLTVERVEQSVAKNGMLKIATASASRAAAGQSIKISGDAVVLVFRNDFARRILAVSQVAGIEAPLPIHIRETPTGVIVAWKSASEVYGVYGRQEINSAAAELDGIFQKIVDDAVSK